MSDRASLSFAHGCVLADESGNALSLLACARTSRSAVGRPPTQADRASATVNPRPHRQWTVQRHVSSFAKIALPQLDIAIMVRLRHQVSVVRRERRLGPRTSSRCMAMQPMRADECIRIGAAGTLFALPIQGDVATKKVACEDVHSGVLKKTGERAWQAPSSIWRVLARQTDETTDNRQGTGAQPADQLRSTSALS